MDKFDPEALPSYHESLKQPSHQSMIEAVQRERIRNLPADYIHPLLASQASSAIYKMTFALVPSDVENLQNNQKPNRADVLEKHVGASGTDCNPASESIEGFAEDENVRLIRLRGNENGARFWEQPSVVSNLERGIRQILGLSPDHTEGWRANQCIQPGARPRKTFLGRLPKAATQASKGPFADEIHRSAALDPMAPHVEVQVAVEEVCLRYETPMGLYDTRTGMALVIRVHFWPK